MSDWDKHRRTHLPAPCHVLTGVAGAGGSVALRHFGPREEAKLGRNVEAVVWAVAGCLFEVSMPEHSGSTWALAGPPPGVTLLSESLRGDERHFRFRAEEEGARMGEVSLRFRSLTQERGMVLRMVVVHVAPETDPAT